MMVYVATAWVAILTGTAFYLAANPDRITNWLLRDADSALARHFRIRERTEDHTRSFRAACIATGCVGIALLLLLGTAQ